MSIDGQHKILDRVKKLLKMTKSDNEHEAANAAARAAKLIEEYQLSEALLRVDDDTMKPEQIVEAGGIEGEPDDSVKKKRHKRVAWKGVIAYAVADSLGAIQWWDENCQLRCYGRESAVQAWNYTCRYLFNEVDRLCHETWERDGELAELAGHRARGWKNAFRVGAASTIARRLRAASKARIEAHKRTVAAAIKQADTPVSKEQQALVLVEKDVEEVRREYDAFGERNGFRKLSAIGHVSSYTGFDAGKEAGETVNINRSRGGLPEGRRRIGEED